MSAMGKSTNILMLGWELPPHHSGGLGRACEGMTKGLSKRDVAVSFVLPKVFKSATYSWMDVHDASGYLAGGFNGGAKEEQECLEFVIRHQCALMRGYFAPVHSGEVLCKLCFKGGKIAEFSHVDLYAKGVMEIARRRSFHAVHGHDWMTYPAAILARKVAAKAGRKTPFIAHVHATEIDRHDGSHIYRIEKEGMEAADRIVTVSNYTKSIVAKYYGIDPDKISVVHNGIEPRTIEKYPRHPLKRRHKVVLFIGRVTYQKGPDYYVRLAKKVTDQYDNVKFLMVGSGDMQASMIELAARENLTGKLLFSSWIGDDMMDAAYQMADVFVMPSVSEPFGIVPLEAIQNGTPVVVSRNSGFVEVVRHCIAVDFWDIDKMAEAIAVLLKHEGHARNMVLKAQDEIEKLTWDVAAEKLCTVYGDAIKEVGYA
ncbi:MAG: glycosyltransferase family 4 protein [Actinobacteria bacterium]|nr:glycosyltransferase family 4 protein [Actinomycetota bacterium]